MVGLALLLCVDTRFAVSGEEEPAGPPGSAETRMKNLNQIEPRTIISSIPYTITNRGSYYLTQNLSDVLGTNGITIAASDVTLDLNGFVLSGNTNATSGITLDKVTNVYMNISIRNGVVKGWGSAGVSLWDGINCRLSGITAVENGSCGGTGIYVGKDWDVDNCLVFRNYNIGMSVGDYTRVRNCRARDNGGNGFHTGIGSVIQNCAAIGNRQYGFFGQTLSMIADCVAICNTNDGIYVGPNSIATRNLSGQNGGNGISAGGSSKLDGNLASFNGGDGINVSSDSLVTHNQVTGNKNAGVLGGWGCRIESNHSTANGFGLKAMDNSQRNFFVGNTTVGNGTNIVTSTTANFGRIYTSGDLGPDFVLPGPWSNFDLQ